MNLCLLPVLFHLCVAIASITILILHKLRIHLCLIWKKKMYSYCWRQNYNIGHNFDINGEQIVWELLVLVYQFEEFRIRSDIMSHYIEFGGLFVVPVKVFFVFYPAFLLPPCYWLGLSCFWHKPIYIMGHYTGLEDKLCTSNWTFFRFS